MNPLHSFLSVLTAVLLTACERTPVENVDSLGSWMELPVAGCGFLLEFNGEIYAATAKHVLTCFRSEPMDAVDFAGTLRRWHLFP